MKRQTKKQKILFWVLLALELFLTISKFGIIQYGKLSITILQIPIIIGTIILGLPQGFALSGVFGVCTMLKAMSYPPETIDSAFQNPMISVAARLMIPIVVWAVFKGIDKMANDNTPSSHVICSGITAIFGALSNTLFVSAALVLFAPEKLGVTNSLSATTIIVTNVIGMNAIFEVVCSVIVTSILVPILYPIINKDKMTKKFYPVNRTFNKWLILLVTIGFFVVSVLFYGIQTNQNQQSARKLLNQKYDDIVQILDSDDITNENIKWTVGENGSTIIAKDKTIVYSNKEDLIGKNMPDYNKEAVDRKDDSYFHTDFDNTTGIGIMKIKDNYEVFLFLPDSEVFDGRASFAAVLLTAIAVLFIILYISISKIIKSKIVDKIRDTNEVLYEIQNGDLDKKVLVTGNKEFVLLADGINSTVDALKKKSAEIVNKINEEMTFARTIQLSSLPTTLQMKAHKDSIDLYAAMKPAKEVGGDFYDYYMIDDNHLAFLVADVSGKGISAAMFMMKAKTLIKSNAEQNIDIDKVFTLTNEELCKNNDAEMFVTCWMGILDLDTYKLEFTNAGHNPPLVKNENGSYEYLKVKPDFVLGGMSGIKYKKHTVELKPNQEIFIYTDGVTEATDANEELYSDERLYVVLNSIENISAKEVCKTVYESTVDFVGNAPQFDDITTLCLKVLPEKTDN